MTNSSLDWLVQTITNQLRELFGPIAETAVLNHAPSSDGGAIFSGSQHFAVFGGTFTHITKNYHSSSSVPSGNSFRNGLHEG
jgi:hypothetical protein